MKILFIGCVASSESFLKAIYHETNATIVGVVTKKKSSFNSDHVSLGDFCEMNKIDWIDYEGHNQLLEWVRKKTPDIIYCFGWSNLLPKEIYSIPPLGAIGYHPALLPKNRGRHPIIWALVLGLKETGSTFFQLTDEPDAGDIWSQLKITIEDFEDASSLYEKLLFVGKQQVIELTSNIMNRKIIPVKQDEMYASYWRKRSKQDGKIDWRMGASTIVQLIRALTKPYVGAHFEYNGVDIIIWRAEVVCMKNIESIEPGKVVSVDGNTFVVKTADNLLHILEFEGTTMPKVGEYL